MSKPKRVESYPSQLFELVLRFEQGGGKELVIAGLRPTTARGIRGELYGLRTAIEKAGRAEEFPHFMSARLYVNGGSVKLVSADELPYAKQLGTILNNG
jgi:hypothetical protein